MKAAASVQLNTSHGAIVIKLHADLCPRTCRNFIELAKHGYYDGVKFHCIIKDFVAQTGDPHGNGSGGESIYGPTFADEINAKLGHNKRGVVSMTNAGRNTNSSQFFLAFKAVSNLDGKHTVFGYVTEDTISVLDDIENVKTSKNNKPLKPVQIYSAEVLENPWKGQPLPADASIPEKPLVGKDSCVTM